MVALAGAALGLPAHAAPVAEALQRPALTVKAPQRAALLSAAQAGARIVAVGERGLVALSDDGGRTWRQAPSPVSVTLTTVRFADDKQGVAVGHGGTVLTTQDAGASWQLRLDGRRLAALARDAATTPEAQREAERLLADGPDKPLLDVLLWDARRLLAVGAFGLAVYSEDGGQTWQPWMARLPNPKGLHWYVARRQGETLLLAGEQGLLARSDDGGRSFRALASPYKGSWFTGELRADGSTVLAGLRGNVWRSTDAGATWSALANPVPATVTAMSTLPDGGLLLASQAGVLMRLQGERLLPLKTPPLTLPAALLPLAEGRLLALGLAGASTLTLPALEEARP
ncbi:hypothetical protein EOE66_18705 [Rubrivivax rivuli]|uniref:Photosynthesis system II assembly factor Ycf48/Hcf136-like domain-containing protein n=1 Tax=Rubrivivax rivuli TaxID=1862385 RepID=A0A437RAA8_9BURK|nr:hypothetical protein EOE66_18705 [Rubrivivax rivuli]